MDKLEFIEKDHLYFLEKENGERLQLLSVTSLLKKHGLSPSYGNVDPQVLKLKAERGKIIHKELEEYIKEGKVGFTGELEAFISTCFANDINPEQSEFMVNNEEIAGTVDVAGKIGDFTFIGDFKTTATLHREAVAWQLSIYAYLMGKQFDKYFCFHFKDENTCKIVEVNPVPIEEIERLLECERNCELYQRKTFELDTLTCESLLNVQNELKKIDEHKKQLEQAEAEIKDFLIKKMEETGVKSIDNEYFKITYTAPTTRDSIDSKRLKAEMPEIAKQYTNTSPVKAKITITIK